MKRLITALVLLLPVAGISHQPPPEVLFMGKLEKLELIPRGESGCPEPKGREGQVVFSNSCGCGSARFSVEAAVVPKRLRKHTVDYSIGEWCEPGIHLFGGARFLVYKASNKPYRWVEAVETSRGNQGFHRDQLDPFFHDFGIDEKEVRFGPETAALCGEQEGEVECVQEPVVLFSELVKIFHITKGSARH